MLKSGRPIPEPTPETKHFWDGTKNGELILQRCSACNKAYFPPRPFCPECGSRKIGNFKSGGKGILYSYLISHRPSPGFDAPYAIAVVELSEGPRMMTNIVDCPQTPEALQLDMPVEVVFEPVNDHISLPLFRPCKGA